MRYYIADCHFYHRNLLTEMINCFCMYSDYMLLTLEERVECDQRWCDKTKR